jgi:hypothetical protein
MSLKAGSEAIRRKGLLFLSLVLRHKHRWGGGNVEIAQRFPRAVGNEGKPGFGFPRFPGARHFHGHSGIHLGAPLVLEAGEQFVLRLSHVHGGLGVRFRPGRLLQLIHSHLRSQESG